MKMPGLVARRFRQPTQPPLSFCHRRRCRRAHSRFSGTQSTSARRQTVSRRGTDRKGPARAQSSQAGAPFQRRSGNASGSEEIGNANSGTNCFAGQQ
jgi:hypothetical protein